jgi:flavin reductase (DIM6/NTAB) family NADH-FMN oxidoreductase RutF
LAPFSFFNAFSASPMFVGVSIGERGGVQKDTLVNIRSCGAFCVNVVSEPLLEAMNKTSAEVRPEVDEFDLVGLECVPSGRVEAPFVGECSAVLECLVFQEVELRESTNTLVIGEVVGVLLRPELEFEEGTCRVAYETLGAVGRLSGTDYLLPLHVRGIPRP